MYGVEFLERPMVIVIKEKLTRKTTNIADTRNCSNRSFESAANFESSQYIQDSNNFNTIVEIKKMQKSIQYLTTLVHTFIDGKVYPPDNDALIVGDDSQNGQSSVLPGVDMITTSNFASAMDGDSTNSIAPLDSTGIEEDWGWLESIVFDDREESFQAGEKMTMSNTASQSSNNNASSGQTQPSVLSSKNKSSRFQEDENGDTAFQEMFKQFCETASEEKFEQGLSLLKQFSKMLYKLIQAKVVADYHQPPNKDDVEVIKAMACQKDVLALQLALTLPEKTYATHGKALKEMCLICLRHARFNIWKTKELLHQYMRFRLHFIGDLNEQVTQYSSDLLNIFKKVHDADEKYCQGKTCNSL